MSSAEVRYRPWTTGEAVVCEDCGCAVVDRPAHNRFHSILGSHAWALAVLKMAHLAEHIHDRWEVVEKINSKRFDNWSADAFAEVVATLDGGAPGSKRRTEGE